MILKLNCGIISMHGKPIFRDFVNVLHLEI